MTYFPVQPRYSVYVDSLGDPLDDGYIYLGKANLDPTVYPAKASWDEAGLYPITFPVRTMNGYPLRDGIPAQMYLNFADNTEYSVLINDEDGVEVFSSTTGLIGYFPSTGAGGDADTLEGHPASYFAVNSAVAHLAGGETFLSTMTFQGLIVIDSAGSAQLVLDCNADTNFNTIVFRTNGVDSGMIRYNPDATPANSNLDFFSGGVSTISMRIGGDGTLYAGTTNTIYHSGTSSASDTFTTSDAKTVTVVNGLITSIV